MSASDSSPLRVASTKQAPWRARPKMPRFYSRLSRPRSAGRYEHKRAFQPNSQSVREPLAGLTNGLVREHFAAGLDGEVEFAVREAVKVNESLGAKVKQVSFPHAKHGVARLLHHRPCEASSNLARLRRRALRPPRRRSQAHRRTRCRNAKELLAAGKKTRSRKSSTLRSFVSTAMSRAEGFGSEVKRRIMLGTYALSSGYYDAYYLKALKVRRLIRQDYDKAFEQVDLIAGPCTTSPAFKIGEKVDDALAMYLVDLQP